VDTFNDVRGDHNKREPGSTAQKLLQPNRTGFQFTEGQKKGRLNLSSRSLQPVPRAEKAEFQLFQFLELLEDFLCVRHELLLAIQRPGNSGLLFAKFIGELLALAEAI